MARRTLAVEGMACDGCEETVEGALANVDGVSSADADHETGSVEVVASEGTSDEDLRAAIEESGYDVTEA